MTLTQQTKLNYVWPLEEKSLNRHMKLSQFTFSIFSKILLLKILPKKKRRPWPDDGYYWKTGQMENKNFKELILEYFC